MRSYLRTVLSRIRGTFDRREPTQDSDQELQTHLAMLTERFAGQGMSQEEARYAARRQFGGLTQLQEQLHERRGLPQLEILWRDTSYALLQLRKTPAFAIAALLTLALGIGANTAVFAVVDAVVFRPLPYAHSDRLVSFQSWVTRGNPHPEELSYPNFFDFRSQNKVFEHLVSYRDTQFALAGRAQAQHVNGEIVSWDLFPLLGLQPQMGRGFLPDEEKPNTHVVVLSHELWQSHFGSDPGIVGRSITLNSISFTVVGVAPRGFRFPPDNPTIQIWTTLAEDARGGTFTPLTEQRGAVAMSVMARLKDGVTPAEAKAQMDPVAAALARQYPDENEFRASTYVVPELEKLVGDTRKPMLILLGAVGLVLLIACVNIANLVLARSVERQREMALRTALGASAGSVVRQLLTEGMVLGILGSVAGVALAVGCLHWFLPLVSDAVPRIAEAAIDARVLAFSAALAVVTSVLFSLVPAFDATRLDIVNSLKDGVRSVAHGYERLRGLLVVGQVSLGLVLLSGAAFLAASLLYLEKRNLGFQPDHVLAFDLDVPDARYTVPQQIAFCDQLLQRIRALPGVQSAGVGTPIPMIGSQMLIGFNIEERPSPESNRPRSDMAIVTPGYFGTLGIALLKGRNFSEHDDASATMVLIVNKAFADKFFPGEDIIGKRIASGATNGKTGVRYEQIVGLVENAKQSALEISPEPIYYFPYKQLPWGVGTILARTLVSPRSLEFSARAAVASLDPQIPVYQVRTMEELSASAIAQPRFQSILLGSFAGIALLLTVVGVYGVLTYSVARRTREIGVRIALGATRRNVVVMVLARAMRLLVAGLALGLAGAVAEGYLIRTMLYGVQPTSPLLPLLASAVLVAVSLLAAYLPAQRAASVDAMQALRSE
jgi:predicted permease